MFKEAIKKIKIEYVIQAIVMIVIGIVLIAWSQASLDFMAKALAVLLILVGAVFVVTYIFRKERSPIDSGNFAVGIIVAIIGIWIFVNPGGFTDLIPKIFGVFIIISGIMNLAQTVTLIRASYPLWWISLILALITIMFGLILLLNPTQIKELVVKIIGVFLIYDGISNIWTVSRISKYAKNVEQAAKDANAVDVDAEVVDNNNNSAEK